MVLSTTSGGLIWGKVHENCGSFSEDDLNADSSESKAPATRRSPFPALLDPHGCNELTFAQNHARQVPSRRLPGYRRPLEGLRPCAASNERTVRCSPA